MWPWDDKKKKAKSKVVSQADKDRAEAAQRAADWAKAEAEFDAGTTVVPKAPAQSAPVEKISQKPKKKKVDSSKTLRGHRNRTKAVSDELDRMMFGGK